MRDGATEKRRPLLFRPRVPLSVRGMFFALGRSEPLIGETGVSGEKRATHQFAPAKAG